MPFDGGLFGYCDSRRTKSSAKDEKVGEFYIIKLLIFHVNVIFFTISLFSGDEVDKFHEISQQDNMYYLSAGRVRKNGVKG